MKNKIFKIVLTHVLLTSVSCFKISVKILMNCCFFLLNFKVMWSILVGISSFVSAGTPSQLIYFLQFSLVNKQPYLCS